MWQDSAGNTHWLSEKELAEERKRDAATEQLASEMVEKVYVERNGDEYRIKRIERRGGHNRKVVERLTSEGYINGVWPSLTEAIKMIGIKNDRGLMTKRRGRIGNGMILRYR